MKYLLFALLLFGFNFYTYAGSYWDGIGARYPEPWSKGQSCSAAWQQYLNRLGDNASKYIIVDIEWAEGNEREEELEGGELIKTYQCFLHVNDTYIGDADPGEGSQCHLDGSCPFPHDPEPDPDPDPTPDPGGDDLCEKHPELCTGGTGGGDGTNPNPDPENPDGGTDPNPEPDPEHPDRPDLCQEMPEVCIPPERPECVENPELCDVPDNSDLIASIREITQAVNNHHKTSFDSKGTIIKLNQEANVISMNTGDTASNTAASLDKQEAIKNNTQQLVEKSDILSDFMQNVDNSVKDVSKIISQDTNDIIKQNALDIAAGIDRASSDNSGQLSAIKSELDQIGNEMRKGFCDKNPTHESCVAKSADASTCEKFTCSGEPILCMLLEVEHQKKCFLPDFDGIGKGIDKIISEGDPSELLQSEVMDFSNPDSKYLNGGGVNLNGSCPSPVTANVFGESVEFSYQPLCDIARLLNPFVVAMAWIVAAIAVGRGIGNL